MNRLNIAAAALIIALPLGSCASYSAYQKAQAAETVKNWDDAVTYYEKALDVDQNNMRFRMSLTRARLEASRSHFEKGRTYRAAALTAPPADQMRMQQLAATELELAVKLDSTNQYAAIELQKSLQAIADMSRAADHNSVDEMKKRARGITKAAPPVLNPASDQPISLNFAHETPVKDIYRALGNAFGINVLFDQAVKDDRISIELKDVTAQQALERVMQAANHFYKVLDEHTIIVVPDNPQARRDYEDLVIRTFYLSNGDAEQVTNVVRTMIEARNVFPLKALNAITIRDTADKVRIAEKIIEANDKAKAEVVVDVELLQLDANKARNIGLSLQSYSVGANLIPPTTAGADGKPATGSINLDYLKNLKSNNFSFTVPSGFIVNLIKNSSQSETLANPELRISEGEKATLHIGSRIPVPVSTFSSVNTTGSGNTFAPVTSFQYQDVGIKVSIEPRVHHNREVTLKLTVEVSNVGAYVDAGAGQPKQPTIQTRTIESTIRLKDGETNFLAGLIQKTDRTTDTKMPFIGDIPVLGRLFNNSDKSHDSTDLVLTMTPHIVRIPDITEDDLAPMWVGTTNNLTFRGVSPRIESQSGLDPFNTPRATDQFGANNPNAGLQLSSDGEPGNYIRPEGHNAPTPNQITPSTGSGPADPFNKPAPTPANPPSPQANLKSGSAEAVTIAAQGTAPTDKFAATSTASTSGNSASNGDSTLAQMRLRLSPRLAPQPANMSIKPGQEKIWNIVGMDLEGLSSDQIMLHYDARTLNVVQVMFGPALSIDPKTPPVVTINEESGTIKLVSSNGKPLTFIGGGEVLMLRVHGGLSGETFLVLENPDFKDAAGVPMQSAIAGGRARVE
ncbi:MAG: secretin N-terminal domain-containing protein [Acidobacteriota bacterium]